MSSAAATYNDDEGWSSSSSEEEEVQTVIWKEHYSSAHKILLVGEGDFSFSLCLAKAFKSAPNMVATTIEPLQQLAEKYRDAVQNTRELHERGCVVRYGVDADKMSQNFFLSTQRFDRIIYNFPHVGFNFPEDNGCQIKMNQQLIKGFLSNAKVLLKKENGEVHVTNKLGKPYDDWDLVKEAHDIGFVLYEITPFYRRKYPGYNPKRAHGRSPDEAFKLGSCSTFKFKLSGCHN